MSDSSNGLPFPLGRVDTASVNDQLVGRKFVTSDGELVRLVKAKTALTAPAKKAILYTVTGGARDYKQCTLAATLNAYNVAGVGDNSLTGNVAASEYFFVHCGEGDEVEAIPAATGIAAGDLLGTTTTTAGSVAKVALAATTAGMVNLSKGWARALAASATSLAAIKVELRGLS